MSSETRVAEYVAGGLEQSREHLIESLLRLTRLRWMALAILGPVCFLFVSVAGTAPVQGPLIGVVVVVAIVAGCNLTYRKTVEQLREQEHDAVYRVALSHVMVDFLAIASLVHYSGGIENPLIILTALPLVVASHFLPTRSCNWLALGAISILLIIAVLEAGGVLNHVSLTFMAGQQLWENSGYIVLLLTMLGLLIFGSVRFSTGMTADLDARRAQATEVAGFLGDRVFAIEATLESERVERTKLDEGLRLQWRAAEQEKNELTEKMKSLEGTILGQINKLSTDVKTFESSRETLLGDLEREIAELRESLSLADGVSRELIASVAAAPPTPASAPETEETEELAEEGILEDAGEEEYEEEGEEDDEEYEEDEDEKDEKDGKGEEEDEEEEEDEDEEDEEFEDPDDAVSEALLKALHEIEELPEAEAVLMDIVLSDELPEVMADPASMEELFGGILAYSLSQMPDGGRLAISTAEERGLVTVWIRDTSEPAAEASLEEQLLAERKLAGQIKASLSVEADEENGASYRIQFPIVQEG